MKEEIAKLEASKGENFANAREVRNLFEKIITNQACRVSAMDDVDEETLTTITMDDLKDLDDLSAPSLSEKPKSDEELGELLDDLLKDVPDDKKKKKDRIPVVITRR